MGDLSAMVATAEVFQADIPRLRTGDPATVQVLDQAVTGKVTLIGSIVGKNQLTNLDPRALQDRRVVKVTIGLDDPVLTARFVNMEVEAAIKPGQGPSRSRQPGSPAVDPHLVSDRTGDRRNRGAALIPASNPTTGPPQRGPRRQAVAGGDFRSRVFPDHGPASARLSRGSQDHGNQ